MTDTPIVLTLICAWCLRIMRSGSPDAPASHGICPDCARRLEAEVSYLATSVLHRRAA